ncbi:hypothetical protein JV197_05565, partial [Vibrio furnissii]
YCPTFDVEARYRIVFMVGVMPMNYEERLYRRSQFAHQSGWLGLFANSANTAIVYIVVKLWSATVGLGEVFASLSLSST